LCTAFARARARELPNRETGYESNISNRGESEISTFEDRACNRPPDVVSPKPSDGQRGEHQHARDDARAAGGVCRRPANFPGVAVRVRGSAVTAAVAVVAKSPATILEQHHATP
jgi:hypothetical protein